jgi:hypothetical protein
LGIFVVFVVTAYVWERSIYYTMRKMLKVRGKERKPKGFCFYSKELVPKKKREGGSGEKNKMNRRNPKFLFT